MIAKGIISSIETSPVDRNNDPTHAKVLPCTAQPMPTRPLVISWHLRGKMANLKVGDIVWFAVAEDLTGIILERADGEWTGTIPGNVTCNDLATKNVSSHDTHVHGNGNQGANTTGPKNVTG